jgi:hypothetical protein
MGTLVYGGPHTTIVFEDRALAHVQAALGAKLRRHERFFFSWHDHTRESGSARSSVWIDPAIPLFFHYDRLMPVLLNSAWLDAIAATGDSTPGITLCDEPRPSSPGRPVRE